jgi:hypothetical protein
MTPHPGTRFKYSFFTLYDEFVEKTGRVTSSRLDEIGDLVVNVEYDDGGTDTFWNNSFVDMNQWRGREQVEIEVGRIGRYHD